MAKLYFSYSAMNAGKSTVLLQASHNYGERGMQTMLFTAKLDNRSSVGNITSRIGLSEKALTFENKEAATPKYVDDPPNILSLLPLGVSIESKAIEPTATISFKLFIYRYFLFYVHYKLVRLTYTYIRIYEKISLLLYLW